MFSDVPHATEGLGYIVRQFIARLKRAVARENHHRFNQVTGKIQE